MGKKDLELFNKAYEHVLQIRLFVNSFGSENDPFERGRKFQKMVEEFNCLELYFAGRLDDPKHS